MLTNANVLKKGIGINEDVANIGGVKKEELRDLMANVDLTEDEINAFLTLLRNAQNGEAPEQAMLDACGLAAGKLDEAGSQDAPYQGDPRDVKLAQDLCEQIPHLLRIQEPGIGDGEFAGIATMKITVGSATLLLLSLQL